MLASLAGEAESTAPGVRRVSSTLYWFSSTNRGWSYSSRRHSFQVRWVLGCSLLLKLFMGPKRTPVIQCVSEF